MANYRQNEDPLIRYRGSIKPPVNWPLVVAIGFAGVAAALALLWLAFLI